MWLELRGWWYVKRFGKAEKMPCDVREYIIRRYMKDALAMQKTDKERGELAANLSNRTGLQMSAVEGQGHDSV